MDNTRRFEGDPDRLATAVPEIYALPLLGDRVVLNITDALIGQYEGGARSLLHYSTVLNQLWFSRDPVALDMLAIKELARTPRPPARRSSNPTWNFTPTPTCSSSAKTTWKKSKWRKSARLPLPKRNPIEFLVSPENSSNYENLVDMSTCL